MCRLYTNTVSFYVRDWSVLEFWYLWEPTVTIVYHFYILCLGPVLINEFAFIVKLKSLFQK